MDESASVHLTLVGKLYEMSRCGELLNYIPLPWYIIEERESTKLSVEKLMLSSSLLEKLMCKYDFFRVIATTADFSAFVTSPIFTTFAIKRHYIIYGMLYKGIEKVGHTRLNWC